MGGILNQCTRCKKHEKGLEHFWVSHHPEIKYKACLNCRLDLIDYVHTLQGHPEKLKTIKEDSLTHKRREPTTTHLCNICGYEHSSKAFAAHSKTAFIGKEK